MVTFKTWPALWLRLQRGSSAKASLDYTVHWRPTWAMSQREGAEKGGCKHFELKEVRRTG